MGRRVSGPLSLNELHRKFGVPRSPLAQTQLSRAPRLFGRLWPARDGRCCFVATGREWFLALYFGLTVGMVALTWQIQFALPHPPRRSRWSSCCSPCLRFAGGSPLGMSYGGEPRARWS